MALETECALLEAKRQAAEARIAAAKLAKAALETAEAKLQAELKAQNQTHAFADFKVGQHVKIKNIEALRIIGTDPNSQWSRELSRKVKNNLLARSQNAGRSGTVKRVDTGDNTIQVITGGSAKWYTPEMVLITDAPATATPECHKCHGNYVKSTYALGGYQYGWICDLCRTRGDARTARWFCQKCESDICTSCEKQAGPPNCHRCHGNYVKSTYAQGGYQNGWICDLCRTRGHARIARWFCQKCESDICTRCEDHV